jgi:heme A synthase
MISPITGWFTRLAGRISYHHLGLFVLLSAIFTGGLIVYGSWVRVSASGLGCPDWPLCDGVDLPGNKFAAIEAGHRLLAGITAAMVCASGVFAWLKRKDALGPATLLVAAALLILSQAVLGGIVVLTDLHGFTRLAHLGLGMTILALLFIGGYALVQQPLRARIGPLRPGHLVLLGAGVIMFGGTMVATSTGALCHNLPYCSSESPAMASSLHSIHRTLAILFAIGVIVQGIVLRRRGASRAAWFAYMATFLFTAAQIGAGVATVVKDLPDELRVLHVALATLTWASLISLWSLLSFTGPRGKPRP